MSTNDSNSIGIIGGADGPTAIFITGNPTITIVTIIFIMLLFAVVLYLIIKKKKNNI